MRVFVASNYSEFKALRSLLEAAIENAGHRPTLAERYDAHRTPAAEVEEAIARSDVVVCFYGKKYGHVPEGDTLSVTAQELIWAYEHEVPAYVFVVGSDQGRDRELASFLTDIGTFHQGRWLTQLRHPSELTARLQEVRAGGESEEQRWDSTRDLLESEGLTELHDQLLNVPLTDLDDRLEGYVKRFLNRNLVDRVTDLLRSHLQRFHFPRAVEPVDREIVERYLKRLVNVLGKQNRRYGSSYVELELRRPKASIWQRWRRELRSEDVEPESQIRTRVIRDRLAYLRQIRDLVVLRGGPGSGKSTALRQIAIDMANRAAPDSLPTHVPFFFNLGRYAESTPFGKPGALEPFIALELQALVADPAGGDLLALRQAYQALAREGRLLLLFDAMDEMPERDPEERAARCEKLRSYAALRVEDGSIALFSCRDREDDRAFRARRIFLSSLDKARVRRFVAQHLDDDSFTDADKRRVASLLVDPVYQLDHISRNPFNLRLITQHLNKERPSPEALDAVVVGARQAEIIGVILETLVDNAVGHGEATKRGRRELLDLLGKLAILRFRTDLPDGRVGLEALVGRTSPQPERARELLGRAEREDLIEHETLRGYDFQHMRIREYFAARTLAREGRPPHEALGREIDAYSLNELVELYASMAPRPAAFVEEILPPLTAGGGGNAGLTDLAPLARRRHLRRLCLAARCLAPHQEASPEIVALSERVRRQLDDAIDRGNPLEQVEAVVALRNVCSPKDFGERLAVITDPDPWVHETVVSQLQASRLGFGQFLTAALRSMANMRNLGGYFQLVKKNVGFAWSSPRALTVALLALLLAAGTLSWRGLKTAAILALPALALAAATAWGPPKLAARIDGNVWFLVPLGYGSLVVWYRIVQRLAALRRLDRYQVGGMAALAASATALVAAALAVPSSEPKLPPCRPKSIAEVDASLPEGWILLVNLLLPPCVVSLVWLYRRVLSRPPAAMPEPPVPALLERIREHRLSVLAPAVATIWVVAFILTDAWSDSGSPGTRWVVAGVCAAATLGLYAYFELGLTRAFGRHLRQLRARLAEDAGPQAVSAVLAFLRSKAPSHLKLRAIELLRAEIEEPTPELMTQLFELQDEETLRPRTRSFLWRVYRDLDQRYQRVAEQGGTP